MHTIKPHIEDNIYQNIMFLLSNLKLDGLKIEDDIPKSQNTKEKMKKLFDLKKTSVFETIQDPLVWQKEIRDEW